MELEFSRGSLAALVGLIGGAVLLTLLAVLGHAVTPVTPDGDLLALSPAYVATVRYLDLARERLDRLAEIDAGLTEVMNAQGNIYVQGRDAERAFEQALATARAIARDTPPLSLATLQTTLSEAGSAYVGAAQAVLRWVSAPTETNRQGVDEAIEVARARLSASRERQEGLWPAR